MSRSPGSDRHDGIHQVRNNFDADLVSQPGEDPKLGARDTSRDVIRRLHRHQRVVVTVDNNPGEIDALEIGEPVVGTGEVADQ